jgi:short-subunit dehydrogenase
MQGQPTARISRLLPWRTNIDPDAVHAALGKVAHLQPAVVITGGSRGIGLALAKRFLEKRHETVIVGRSAPRLAAAVTELKAATGTEPVSILCDITEANAADVIAAGLNRAGLYLDVLVNNAGIGLAGPFIAHTPIEISRLVTLNVESVTRLTRAVLPDMIERRRGGILNVASLGAYVPGPNQAAYYASKSYVVSLTEAIASEVSGQGVRISALAPGPVDTGFHREMGAERSLYRLMLPSMTADRVARSAYRGFMFGQRVIVPGIFNIAAVTALKVLPHIITVPIMYAFLKRNLPPR